MRTTKLEVDLKNKKYNKVKEILKKYPRLDKHFLKTEDFKFRKIVIKHAFYKLVDSELRNEILMVLNDPIYEDLLSDYVMNWLEDRRHDHQLFYTSLIEFHKFEFVFESKNYLIARNLIEGFRIDSCEKKLMKYYSENSNRVTPENYNSVKDLLKGEVLFEVFKKFLYMRRRLECDQNIIDDLAK